MKRVTDAQRASLCAVLPWLTANAFAQGQGRLEDPFELWAKAGQLHVGGETFLLHEQELRLPKVELSVEIELCLRSRSALTPPRPAR